MNIVMLLEMSVCGSLAYLVVAGLSRWIGNSVSAQSRRLWWVFVVAALLVPWRIALPVWIPIPETPFFGQSAIAPEAAHNAMDLTVIPMTQTTAMAAMSWETILTWTWGAVFIGLFVYGVTRSALIVRHWTNRRLCTDPALLNLLEDCKAEAGVTVPVGLVVVPDIGSPALLGCIRPRILLPADLVHRLSQAEIRCVFLHELAHFRNGDLLLGWLFSFALALHWFNPIAHIAFRQWMRFREEAADEQAIRWMKESCGESYGRTLVRILTLSRLNGALPVSSAILAVPMTERFEDLQQRIYMISIYPRKTSQIWLTLTVAMFLTLGIFMRPATAQQEGAVTEEANKKAAEVAMEKWLNTIDGSKYADSWQESSKLFQKAIGSEQWVKALTSVRKPLGAVKSRVLASATTQTEIPGNPPIKGLFVLVQYKTSFDNLHSALETVTFEKEADGTWRASGYFIRPN